MALLFKIRVVSYQDVTFSDIHVIYAKTQPYCSLQNCEQLTFFSSKIISTLDSIETRRLPLYTGGTH